VSILALFSTLGEGDNDDWHGRLENPKNRGDGISVYLNCNPRSNSGLEKIIKAQEEDFDYFPDGFINGYWGLTERAALLGLRQTNVDRSKLYLISLTHERPRLAYYGEASAVLKGGWCDRGASQKCNVIEAHYFGLDAVRKDLRSIDFESLEERVLTSFCTSTEAVIELVESFHIEKQLSSDRKTTRTKLRISTPRSHSMQACESVHRTLCQMFDVMSGKALKPTEARIKTHGDQGPPWLTLELSRYFYEHSQANSSHFYTCQIVKYATH